MKCSLTNSFIGFIIFFAVDKNSDIVLRDFQAGSRASGDIVM